MPVFDMSIETLNTVHRFAQFAAIVAAAITLIIISVTYWSSLFSKQHSEIVSIVAAAITLISMLVTYGSSSLIKQHSEIVSAQARDQIDGLTAALEEEQTARARIESGLSSRHLNSDQQAILIGRLRGSNFSVKISTYSDTEAVAYAREIFSALSAAGITAEQGKQIIAAAGSPHRGVFIEDRSPDVLKLAFQEAGIEVTLLPSRRNDLIGTGQGAPVVLIGLKPEAF